MSDSAHSSPTFPTPRRTRKAQLCNMMMRPLLENGLGHFDIGETEKTIAEMAQNVCDALLHLDAVPELISTELFSLLVYQTIYRLAGVPFPWEMELDDAAKNQVDSVSQQYTNYNLQQTQGKFQAIEVVREILSKFPNLTNGDPSLHKSLSYRPQRQATTWDNFGLQPMTTRHSSPDIDINLSDQPTNLIEFDAPIDASLQMYMAFDTYICPRFRTSEATRISAWQMVLPAWNFTSTVGPFQVALPNEEWTYNYMLRDANVWAAFERLVEGRGCIVWLEDSPRGRLTKLVVGLNHSREINKRTAAWMAALWMDIAEWRQHVCRGITGIMIHPGVQEVAERSAESNESLRARFHRLRDTRPGAAK
ncbi:hypothetical protein QBC47DRAFT_408241 [Echria macrotheca]|uniref:Uncharacterized protein n=1 Tax=Echria macrotheca TaxID=438768 RepID=A0AAJ0BKU7_9PEZI|nr:hypothetical protein QBC47DRAFT_408241 [Echria macrotheca]